MVSMDGMVFPAKRRRAVLDDGVDEALKEVCLAIAARYQVKFLETGWTKTTSIFFINDSFR